MRTQGCMLLSVWLVLFPDNAVNAGSRLHLQSCWLLQQHLIPGCCHSPSSSSADAECCCPSGCKEEEMGQYHPDHSWQSSLTSGVTAFRVRFFSWSTSVFTSSPLRTSCRRSVCLSGLGSLYSLPFVRSRSRWPGFATDKNSWLRSTKLFRRWSSSVEQSAAGN